MDSLGWEIWRIIDSGKVDGERGGGVGGMMVWKVERKSKAGEFLIFFFEWEMGFVREGCVVGGNASF